MTGDFNIRDSIWDLDFYHHSLYRNIFFEVANSFQLDLSKSTELFLTRYSDNQWDSNLVINLMFLRSEFIEHNNHSIHLNWRLTSNYAPFTINIHIFEEYVQIRKWTLVKNSEEEDHFLEDLIEVIKKIDTANLWSMEALESAIQLFIYHMDKIWYKYLKITNITKYSKKWWDENYQRDLDTYRQTKHIEDWKHFKGIVRKSKHNFFDSKIQEISNKKCVS